MVSLQINTISRNQASESEGIDTARGSIWYALNIDH